MTKRAIQLRRGAVLIGLQRGSPHLGSLQQSPLVEVTTDAGALLRKVRQDPPRAILLDREIAVVEKAAFWSATRSVVVVDSAERIVSATAAALSHPQTTADALFQAITRSLLDNRRGGLPRPAESSAAPPSEVSTPHDLAGAGIVAEEAPHHWLGTLVSSRRTAGQGEESFRDALRDSFLLRQKLLKDCLSTGKVAELLGSSRQTPHDRVHKGTLLAVSDRGRLHFPRWQFDAAGPGGVVAGLPQVLKALEIEPIAKAVWLTRGNPVFEGRTPLEILRKGEVARVESEASAVMAQAGGPRAHDLSAATAGPGFRRGQDSFAAS